MEALNLHEQHETYQYMCTDYKLSQTTATITWQGFPCTIIAGTHWYHSWGDPSACWLLLDNVKNNEILHV